MQYVNKLMDGTSVFIIFLFLGFKNLRRVVAVWCSTVNTAKLQYYNLVQRKFIENKVKTFRGTKVLGGVGRGRLDMYTSAGSNGPDNRTWPNGDMGVDGVSDDEARSWCSTDAGAYCCWCCWKRRWNCWWISASASAVFRCLGLCRLLASDAPPAAAYMVSSAAHATDYKHDDCHVRARRDSPPCERRRRHRRRHLCLCLRFRCETSRHTTAKTIKKKTTNVLN